MKDRQNRLDLGCGKKKRPGFWGMDVLQASSADVLGDLNRLPLPFRTSSFAEIVADNCLEHVAEPLRVMEELHRIGQPGARVEIIVPYFRSRWAFADPTHASFFSVNSFSYLDVAHPHFERYAYSRCGFVMERRVFNRGLTFSGVLKRPIQFVTRLANRFPEHYEAYFSQLWPLDQISFLLRVKK